MKKTFSGFAKDIPEQIKDWIEGESSGYKIELKKNYD